MLKDFCTWLIENAYPDYERLYRASEGFIPILRNAVESYFQDINEAGSKALLRNKAERIIDQLFADGAVAFRINAEPVNTKYELYLRQKVIGALSHRQMDATFEDFCVWLYKSHKVNKRLWVPTKQAYSYFRSAVVEYFRELGADTEDAAVNQAVHDYQAKLKKLDAIKSRRENENAEYLPVERPDYYLDREMIKSAGKAGTSETE